MANNFRPTVNLFDNEIEIGRKRNFTSLFSVSDLDANSTVTRYRFRDNNITPQSGFFLNGSSRLAAGTWHTFEASQINNILYSAGLLVASESISVQVFDGRFWSAVDADQIATIVRNVQAPEVTASNTSVLSRETLRGDQLFEFSDPEGAEAASYSFIDRSTDGNSGFFTVFGVRKASGAWFTIPANQLSGVRYVGGSAARFENVSVRASDGRFSSPVESFVIQTTANNFAPVVQANNVRAGEGNSIPFANLIRFTDRDGNTLKRFSFFDSGEGANSGYVAINGFRQPANETIVVNASQLSQVTYEAPNNSSSEDILIRVYDGSFWSNLGTSTVTTFSRPVIGATSNDISIDQLERVSVNDLVSQVDNGFRFTKYEVFDENTFFRSGNLYTNNFNRLQEGVVHELTPAEFNTLEFEGAVNDFGRSVDSFVVRGFNGQFWTDWERVNVTTDPVGADSLDRFGPEQPFFALFNEARNLYEITYTFVDSVAPDYYPVDAPERAGTAALDPSMREDVRVALGGLERFARIDFIEVPYETSAAEASIVFGLATDDGQGSVLAHAFLPSEGGGKGNIFSDVWYDVDDFPRFGTEVGNSSTFRATTLHEVGHALGFKHPFQGSPTLPVASSFSYNTVMTNSPGSDPSFHPDAPSNYMLYDIERFKEVYGARTDYNTGNDHYFWGINDTSLQAVHDSGGIDTLNMGNQFVGGGIIDLRQGQRSALNGQNNAVLIPYGVVIENARGTRSADTIIGNETRNLIFGNQGNDIINGRGGNDLLRGGTQSDTYQFRMGDGRDVIREDRQGGRDVISYTDTTGQLDSLRDDFVFRRVGRDLRIDFTLDQGPAQHTVVVKDFSWGASRVETLRLFRQDGEQLGGDIELNSVFLQATTKGQRFRVTNNTGEFGFLATPV